MYSERCRALTVAGGATTVLGAVLPWVASGSLELHANSTVALLAGAAVVTIAIARWDRPTQYAVGAFGVVALALVVEALTDVLGDGPPPGVPVATPTPGLGAYLTIAGGVLVLAGVALERLTDD